MSTRNLIWYSLPTDSFQEKKYSHIEFFHNNTEFRSNVQWWGFGVPSVNKVIFFNQPPIKGVNINSQPCKKPCEYSYNTQTKVLEVNVNLSLDKQFVVSLIYKPKIMFKTGAVLVPKHGWVYYFSNWRASIEIEVGINIQNVVLKPSGFIWWIAIKYV